jgi:hypothetical protein
MNPQHSELSASVHRADLMREARAARETLEVRPSRRSARALLRRVIGE